MGSGRGYGWFRRHGALLGLLACLAALLVVGCSASEAEAPAHRPNIIFVLIDDLDFASAQRMPALRSLLTEEGTSFENAFVSYPLCCPSRATILTGLYTHNHRVWSNQPPEGGFQKFRAEGHEQNTIAVRLQQSGYRTAFFGKYLNHYPGDPSLGAYIAPGWSAWYGKRNANKVYDYRINENGKIVSYGSDTEDYYTDVLSKQTVNFIRRAASGSKPFFMYVSPEAVHKGVIPAERHKEAFGGEAAPRPPSFDEEDVSDKPARLRNNDRFSDAVVSAIDERYRTRLSSLLAVDELVDSIVRELEAQGVLDNTFIVFTSDNGFYLGEHRTAQGKVTPYEESVRVPLFVRGPGVPAGSRVEKLALNTDLAPTFADLAGAEFSADGRSLAPLLRGEEASWRSAILLEVSPEEKNDEEGDEEGDMEGKNVAYEAVRTETHKYVEYINGERELYDLKADPYELDSAHESADPLLLADLKAKLDVLRNCAGTRCRWAEDARWPQMAPLWGT